MPLSRKEQSKKILPGTTRARMNVGVRLSEYLAYWVRASFGNT